jgi:hypothetical protein
VTVVHSMLSDSDGGIDATDAVQGSQDGDGMFARGVGRGAAGEGGEHAGRDRHRSYGHDHGQDVDRQQKLGHDAATPDEVTAPPSGRALRTSGQSALRPSERRKAQVRDL